jgi:hypothetical protein
MENLGLIGLVIVLASTARWFWRAWKVDIPKTPRVFQGLLLLGLICGVISLYMGFNDPSASWAIGVAAVLIFLTATGAQRVDGDMIEVGDSIPAFSAPDDEGNSFDMASLAGSRVLLKFFRGHW